MHRHHILTALLITTFAFALWSWNRPAPSASTAQTPRIAPGSIVTYNGQTFAPVELHLVDRDSGLPLQGAEVHVICLGGTPFGNQTNWTNTRGTVEEITYQNASFVPLRITAPGFRPTQWVANTSDPVVKLSLKSL